MFPYRMEKQLKSRSNKFGVTPDHFPASGVSMPGMGRGIDDRIRIEDVEIALHKMS